MPVTAPESLSSSQTEPETHTELTENAIDVKQQVPHGFLVWRSTYGYFLVNGGSWFPGKPSVPIICKTTGAAWRAISHGMFVQVGGEGWALEQGPRNGLGTT